MANPPNILAALDAACARHGDAVALVRADDGASVTWRQLRQRSAKVGYALQRQGAARGSRVPHAMGTCLEHAYLLLGAAYAGVSLVSLNDRLTQGEREARLASVLGARRGAGAAGRAPAATGALPRVLAERDVAEWASEPLGVSSKALGQWANRGASALREDDPAVVMFTSGTQGDPKAACLAWGNLCGAARLQNDVLGTEGGVWQLALPMCHVGGLQVLVRSLLAGVPCVLHGRFDAQQVLRAGAELGCTHVSVVDKMLQDMLAAPNASEAAGYECVLLGGAAPNPGTLAAAERAGVRVVASYGMTETSSFSAWAPACRLEEGMQLLPGYRATVLAPDERGFGQLALGGAGVCAGYLNARADFTADGCLITGDRARLDGGRLHVAERTDDMFVSGGENVYPEEIRRKILGVPGVTDAFVFGAEDAQWGRRPVAFVEMAQEAARPGFSAAQAAEEVRASLSRRLARIYQPRDVFVLEGLPRRGVGKVNRGQLMRQYGGRLQLARVDVWRVSLPLADAGRPVLPGAARSREGLLVQVTDWAGRVGVGEATPARPVDLAAEVGVIGRVLAPLALGAVMLHPGEFDALVARRPQAAAHPVARAALESALWDLHGTVMGRTVRSLVGGREQVDGRGGDVPAGCVPQCAAVGLRSVRDTLAAVEAACGQGVRTVCLAVRPGHDVKVAAAVRKAFPQVTLLLDAGGSYTEEHLGTLRLLDELTLACIVEPLDEARRPRVGPQTLPARLARLQRELRAPVAVEGSWTSTAKLTAILQAHPDLRCVVARADKLGGVQPALDFVAAARARGVSVWMDGSGQTGVGARLHAALGMLPGCRFVSQLHDTVRPFAEDVCNPPFLPEDGALRLNGPGHEVGLGCSLDAAVLRRVAVGHWDFVVS